MANTSIKSELKNLFLANDFLIVSLSVYFGTVLQNFLDSLVKNLFLPLLYSILPKHLQFTKIKFLNIDIELREIAISTLNLVIGILISYIILRVLIKKLK
jgi:hypothetical protein